MEVLILGNGLSRLAHNREIEEWRGPVWGCNRVYIDHGARLELLAGHQEVMVDAVKYRKNHDLKFKIIGGVIPAEERWTCPKWYWKDTGTTFVAEALHRGMSVAACGFDLGGPDLYSPEHEKQDKSIWVRRWRRILADFGHERVRFIGHDHKPFLRSGEDAVTYARKYQRGEPHIPGEKYAEAVAGWDNSKYDRILAECPLVELECVGRREWVVIVGQPPMTPGTKRMVPEGIAEMWIRDYPREFRVNIDKA